MNFKRPILALLTAVTLAVGISSPQKAQAENSYQTILSSAARHVADTTTCTGGSAGQFCSAAQTNTYWRGVRLFLNVTAEPAAAAATCKMQNYDYTSTTWQDIPGAAFATIDDVTSDDVNLTLYPGVAETANVSVSDVLGRQWRVHCAVTQSSLTFSIGAHLLE